MTAMDDEVAPAVSRFWRRVVIAGWVLVAFWFALCTLFWLSTRNSVCGPFEQKIELPNGNWVCDR